MSLSPRVFVGMSGGVDSSVAAALLVEAGFDVTGVYMKNWSQDLPGARCPWAEDLADAKRVAVDLGIDLKVYDFETEYKQKVVDYMLAEYRAGRTPNPDVMCNQEIKFKLFLETALEDGADLIATGHYARAGNDITRSWSSTAGTLYGASAPMRSAESTMSIHSPASDDQASGSVKSLVRLLRAKDAKKDQTYFLYRVSQEALAKTVFPLGDLTKIEVRKIAESKGLITARKKDSIGICFVGQVGIEEFLGEYLDVQPGKTIEISTNRELGWHKGAFLYTVGQRHGLDIGGGLPYYVVKKDMAQNIVFVSQNLNQDELWTDQLQLENLHWIGDSPQEGGEYQVRTRHLAPLVDAKAQSLSKKQLVLKLKSPQRVVASGQSVVVYDDQVCLGGGVVV